MLMHHDQFYDERTALVARTDALLNAHPLNEIKQWISDERLLKHEAKKMLFRALDTTDVDVWARAHKAAVNADNKTYNILSSDLKMAACRRMPWAYLWVIGSFALFIGMVATNKNERLSMNVFMSLMFALLGGVTLISLSIPILANRRSYLERAAFDKAFNLARDTHPNLLDTQSSSRVTGLFSWFSSKKVSLTGDNELSEPLVSEIEYHAGLIR